MSHSLVPHHGDISTKKEEHRHPHLVHTTFTNDELTRIHKPIRNINAPRDSLSTQIQTDFMDAMTNAIIRFLDKHKNSNKTKAEQSVFIALGYDLSIESERTMEANLSHFRRHHIMRNRDAIRTFRIKQIHQNVLKQHPNYCNEEVLAHLTQKLNSIYLPPPAPAAVDKKEVVRNDTIISTESSDSKEFETTDSNKEMDRISVKSKSISVDDDKYIKHADDIAMDNTAKRKIKNVNYTINNHCCTNSKEAPSQNNNKSVANRVKKQRDVSPSQIYVASPQNHVIKYKKKRKQTIGIGGKSHKKVNIILAQNAYHYPAPTNSYLSPPAPSPFYMMDDIDQVTQKIKLHKKSRKRKFAFNEYEANNMNSFEFDKKHPQPPKKRVRKDLIHHRKGRGLRAMNKTRRGRAKSNRNQYEYDEDEGSDIDKIINEPSQTTTNSQHIL